MLCTSCCTRDKGTDPTCFDTIGIEKPCSDHREYRPFSLDNGLRAIAISDCKCDKSAAALSVKTGSIFDPKEVQGLAHFLEHMLFLGTEKYPEEEEYNKFLAKHGGMSNAFTQECLTNFFFCVSPDHLEGALDRFSQFFISPLFTESATDRELKAVDSEHSKNQQSDMWRVMQLLKNDANPQHALCHFATGNLETLKTIPEKNGYPVRQRLLEFHQKYYSANLMCVAVLGKQSLNELEQMIRTMFGPVDNRRVSVPTGQEIGGSQQPFLLESWPLLVRVVPVRQVRSATFQFVLPQQLPARWRTQPHIHASFMIGHEGKGSLLSALKTRGLVTNLVAGPAMDEAGVCIFEVTVQLTEKGESEVKCVGEHLFVYIQLLQQTPVTEELFNENKRIKDMNFYYRSLTDPMNAVCSLSAAMQDNLPIEKVFSGPARFWDFSEDHITEVISYLTCANLRVLLMAKSFEDAGSCTETETWYGTKFSREPLPKDWHTAWEAKRTNAGSAAAAKEDALALGMALPRPNPFVAERLEIKKRPSDGVSSYPKRVALAKVPGSKLQVYFRQDDKFDLPKAIFRAHVYCPWASESLESRIMTQFYCNALKEELNEFSYDAQEAGLSYSLDSLPNGFSLALGGYQDKLPVLLRSITEKMASTDRVAEHTFSLVHTVMLRSLRSATKTKKPTDQAAELERRTLSRTAATSAEFLKVVEALTCADLCGVQQKLLNSCYAEVLLQGNYESSEIDSIMDALEPAICYAADSELSVLPAIAYGELPGGPRSCVLLRRNGFNPEEKNGAVTLTLQAARESVEHVILCQLAHQILGQRCFDELRTKQQLGYIVDLRAWASSIECGFCGLKVTVQSEKHPAEVHRRIDAFLDAELTKLTSGTGSSDETLGEYVEALLTLLREKPKKLLEEFSQNWAEIANRRFRFTRREETIAFLERPRAEVLLDFRHFVKDKLIPAPRIVVEIAGSVAQAMPATEVAEAESHHVLPYGEDVEKLDTLEDIDAFRTRLQWFESNSRIVAGN